MLADTRNTNVGTASERRRRVTCVGRHGFSDFRERVMRNGSNWRCPAYRAVCRRGIHILSHFIHDKAHSHSRKSELYPRMLQTTTLRVHFTFTCTTYLPSI